jgi:hypothetical protein
VTAQGRATLASCVEIEVAGETLVASPGQPFYLPQAKVWRRARSLRPGNALLCASGNLAKVDAVKHVEGPVKMAAIGVAGLHTYFVSRHAILAHNWLPFTLGFGINFSFGLGKIAIEGLYVGACYLGAWLGSLWFSKKKDDAIKAQVVVGGGSIAAAPASPPPEDPEGDDNEKKKEEQQPAENMGGNEAIPLEARGGAENGSGFAFPKGRSQIMHIFDKSKLYELGGGHFEDTPKNRVYMLELLKNGKNYYGLSSKHQLHWYAEIRADGKQYWASVRDGVIQDCGLNNTPRVFDPETGLCRNITKCKKIPKKVSK